MKIPGLSFSWKRALGITSLKQRIARKTGIPTTRQGRHTKLGRTIIKGFGTLGVFLLSILGIKKGIEKVKAMKSENAEYTALKNISLGKEANFRDITNPDYVTRPTYSTDMTSYYAYVPQLTEAGKEALRRYEESD